MASSRQLPPELVYDIIADLIAGYIDHVVMIPTISDAHGGLGSDSVQNLFNMMDDGLLDFADIGSDEESDQPEEEPPIPTPRELAMQNRIPWLKSLNDAKAGMCHQINRVLLPANYVRPLLYVSHDVREVTLSILSEVLEIPRLENGKLRYNPWLYLKALRRLRRKITFGCFKHTEKKRLDVRLPQGPSLLSAYSSLALAEMMEGYYISDAIRVDRDLFFGAFDMLEKTVQNIPKDALNYRIAERLRMKEKYLETFKLVAQFRAFANASVSILPVVVQQTSSPWLVWGWVKKSYVTIKEYARGPFGTDAAKLSIIPQDYAEHLNIVTAATSMQEAFEDLLEEEFDEFNDQIDELVDQMTSELTTIKEAWEGVTSFAPSYVPLP